MSYFTVPAHVSHVNTGVIWFDPELVEGFNTIPFPDTRGSLKKTRMKFFINVVQEGTVDPIDGFKSTGYVSWSTIKKKSFNYHGDKYDFDSRILYVSPTSSHVRFTLLSYSPAFYLM